MANHGSSLCDECVPSGMSDAVIRSLGTSSSGAIGGTPDKSTVDTVLQTLYALKTTPSEYSDRFKSDWRGTVAYVSELPRDVVDKVLDAYQNVLSDAILRQAAPTPTSVTPSAQRSSDKVRNYIILGLGAVALIGAYIAGRSMK